MTPSQVQLLIDNNLIEKEDANSDEYVEVQVPNWMIEILLLFFPERSPDKSLEVICEQFIEHKKQIKLN